MIKCPNCGKLWAENYCPECMRTIDRSLVLRQPRNTANATAASSAESTGSASKPERAQSMRKVLSWLIFWLALCLVAAILHLSYLWVEIVHFRDGMGFALFMMLFTPATLIISVVLVMIPSLILYKRSRARRDIQSFWIAVASSLVILSEAVAMYVLLNGQRLHGLGG